MLDINYRYSNVTNLRDYVFFAVVSISVSQSQLRVPRQQLQSLHDNAAESGDAGWGPEGRLATYAGASVGLIQEVDKAATIVSRVREETVTNFRDLANVFA